MTYSHVEAEKILLRALDNLRKTDELSFGGLQKAASEMVNKYVTEAIYIAMGRQPSDLQDTINGTVMSVLHKQVAKVYKSELHVTIAENGAIQTDEKKKMLQVNRIDKPLLKVDRYVVEDFIPVTRSLSDDHLEIPTGNI